MEKLQLFNKLRESQKLSDLFYPEAKEWMWNYCLNLGKFTDSEGRNYDLGIYIDDEQPTMTAIVYGSEPGNYISGRLNKAEILEHQKFGFEHYVETIHRATKLGLL